jgi:hypothetical protein
MKTIWLKIRNDPDYRHTQDWHHTYTLSTTKIVLDRDEEDDFVYLFEIELEDDMHEFYIVLFFFENYFADYYVFKNIEEATECFNENIRTRQDLRDEEIQVIEKSSTGEMTSTVYEENNHYYNPKYIWPDKSTRWILKKFDLSDI